MPTTAATVLVIVVAIIPGALGSYLYAAINGLDWRRKEWDTAVRYVAFSAIGLVGYVLMASVAKWPPAAHIIPATYTDPNLRADALAAIAVPYLGHIAAGGLVGVLAAFGARLVAHATSSSALPSSWDVFAKTAVPGRWATVTLKSGDVFAGIIRIADVGVAAQERDLILGEPALLDPDSRKYVVTPYHEVFLPAALIQNVAVLSAATDERIGPIPGKELFPQEVENAERQAKDATNTATTPAADTT